MCDASSFGAHQSFQIQIYIPREACPKGGQFKLDHNGELAILCPCPGWLREENPAGADEEWWVMASDYIQFTVSYVSFNAKRGSPLYVKGDMQVRLAVLFFLFCFAIL